MGDEPRLGRLDDRRVQARSGLVCASEGLTCQFVRPVVAALRRS